MSHALRSHHRVKVDLELTPTWWRRLASNLTSKPEHAQARALLAQAIAIALEVPLAIGVRVERQAFSVTLAAPRDTTTELLAQVAETCRTKLHALDVTCLANTHIAQDEPH